MKSIVKNIIIVFLWLWLPIFVTSAPLYTSISGGGNWIVGATWGGSSPPHNQTTTGDSISIESYVTLTDVLNVKTGTTLIVRAGDTLKIDGDATFANGAVITVEAGAALWVTGDITNNNNSNTITINGVLIVNGNFGGGNGSEIGGSGEMDIDGDVTTTGSGSVFGSTDDCTSNCSSSAGSPLPISLISFEAHINNDNVQLNWSTATEINNDFFTIEKSNDGKNWEVVSTVDGAGNSSQLVEYFDTDYNPFDGTSYYRLKQTDFNGRFSYSNVVPVNLTTKDDVYLSLFPSPIFNGQTLNIQLNNTSAPTTLVVLRDVKGREFYSEIILHKDYKDLITIPVTNEIPAGMYLITATSNNHFYSKRLIVQ